MITFTENLVEFVGEEGYSDEYGARPILRVITKFVQTPLSKELLLKQKMVESIKEIEEKFKVKLVDAKEKLKLATDKLTEIEHRLQSINTSTNELALPADCMLENVIDVMLEFKATLNTVAMFKFSVKTPALIVAVALTSAELFGKNTLLSSITVDPITLIAIFAPLNSATTIYLFLRASISSCCFLTASIKNAIMGI
jgi:hypothetical protein